MPNLVQLTTSQFNTFTRQRLRRILVWVIIWLVALLAIGVIVSLFWPKEWNPLLVSLILNITSGLIGAAVAILTAIFVVQKFLDDRKKEEETKSAQYNAIWRLVQITSIKVEMYTIANICLFVAFGKDRYQKLVDCDVNDIPDSVGDFIYAFTRRLVNETEKTSETSFDKEKHSKEDKQTWSRWKQAFASEVPIKTSCSTRDVDILLEMLHGHKADIQELLYLIQPFMLDKMGMAYALVNLSSGLGLAINTIQQHMAYEIARNPHGHFNLCEAVTHRIVNLGYYAVRVKEMLSANRENDLSAITDWFPPDIKSEANI